MPQWCIVLVLYKPALLPVFHICRKIKVAFDSPGRQGSKERARVYFVLATDGKEVNWIPVLLIYMCQKTEKQWRDKISRLAMSVKIWLKWCTLKVLMEIIVFSRYIVLLGINYKTYGITKTWWEGDWWAVKEMGNEKRLWLILFKS